MKQVKFLSRSNLLLCAGLLGAAVLTGCGKEEIKVYTAPKDVATKALFTAAVDTDTAPGDTPTAPIAAPAQAPLTWKTPAQWNEGSATGMRVGSFTITEGDQKADMAIMPFPDSIGGELENVNRWRGELGLDPVKDGEFTSETVKVGSDTAKLYDLSGEQFGTLSVWLQKDGVHWFFKMRGDKELVAKNKPVLVDFLKTIEFNDPEKDPAPAQTAQVEEEEAPSEDDSEGPKWQTPSHWKVGPEKPMVVKNWDMTGEAGKTANVAINFFPRQAGGLVENVNRWRGQLTLPPMNEAEVRNAIKTLETSDGQTQATYVDFTGKDRTGQPARMIAAIVSRGDEGVWYYKILGDGAVVEREKTAFLKLVQTADY